MTSRRFYGFWGAIGECSGLLRSERAPARDHNTKSAPGTELFHPSWATL